MTRAESMRVMRPLFQAEEGGSTPTSALQLFFSTTNRNTFRELNKAWHSRLPEIGASQGRAYYVAEHAGVAHAVAMWSNPVARLLPQQTWLELRRLAICSDAPKNTASRFISWMVRDIRRSFPDVEKLISYQDCEVHVGTIYKASWWIPSPGYVGRKRGWEASNGGGCKRSGRTNQAVAVRMRWELDVKSLKRLEQGR